MRHNFIKAVALAALLFSFSAKGVAQVYEAGLIDKTVAVVGGDAILLSQIEDEVKMMRANGYPIEADVRCQILEQMLKSKIFLTQARLDSLVVTEAQVAEQVEMQYARTISVLGGEKEVEEYFGKPTYQVKADWSKALEEQLLIQDEQRQVVSKVPKMTPSDIRKLCDETPEEDLPIVPVQYKLRQIVVYPNKEEAVTAVKAKLLDLRERIIAGEKFSTLARLYSQDGTAANGGDLPMSPKSLYWPQFSDAAMALKEGQVSQIVETPDGYHLIQMIEKKGDMFHARHIIIRPEYTQIDRTNAFSRLDSLKNLVTVEKLPFEMVALRFSEDFKTRTNGGMVADESTGSSRIDKDRLQPQDYSVLKDMQPGDVSEPFESIDSEKNTVYKIIKIEEVIPAHTATFETDFDVLMDFSSGRNAERAIENFLTEKKKTTNITIDRLWGGCSFVDENWIR